MVMKETNTAALRYARREGHLGTFCTRCLGHRISHIEIPMKSTFCLECGLYL